MRTIVLIAALVLCLLWLADTLAFHFSRQPYGMVPVRRYYAMPLKGGRTEYGDAGIQRLTCVHTLLPHAGFAPCWYAGHKREKWVTE